MSTTEIQAEMTLEATVAEVGQILGHHMFHSLMQGNLLHGVTADKESEVIAMVFGTCDDYVEAELVRIATETSDRLFALQAKIVAKHPEGNQTKAQALAKVAAAHADIAHLMSEDRKG